MLRRKLPSRLGPRSLLLYLSICALMAANAEAQNSADILRLRKRTIEAVRFEGNVALSSAELQSVVQTYHSEWYEHLFNSVISTVGMPVQYIDPEVQDADTLRLIAYYRRQGYLDAHARYVIHEDSASAAKWQRAYDRYRMTDQARHPGDLPDVSDTVVFQVYEGPRYSIDHFAVEGLEHIDSTLARKVNGETLLTHGSPFTEQSLLAEARRVETILRENGYAFFSSPRDSSKLVLVDRDRKTLNINLVYQTGPRVRNGGLVVTYDTIIRSRGTLRSGVVKRSIELDSGQWYRYTDLANSERNLGMLGVFEAYRVDLDTSAYSGKLNTIPEGTALPVRVQLRMQSTMDLTPSAFAGFGGASRGAGGLAATFNNRSLFNGAESFTAQLSWQFIPSSDRRVSGSLQLSVPYVFGHSPLIILGNASNVSITDLYKELVIEAIFSSNILLSNAGALPRVTYSPDISLEYVDRVDNTGVVSTTPMLTSRQFNVPITPINLTLDWTNDLLNPTTGSILLGALQFATPDIADLFQSKLPSASYAKVTAQAKTYLDASRNGTSVVALRLSLGSIALTNPSNPDRDIPIERRLFGGGPNSLRGWGSRGIVVSQDTAHSPLLGGYKSIEANIEWRYAPFQYPVAITSLQRLLTDLRLAFFADAGNIWDRPLSPAIKNSALDAGLGIHYNTLIGVIRLDIGMKVYDPDPSSTGDRPMSPTATGEWIWNRHFNFWDLSSFQFALGQSF